MAEARKEATTLALEKEVPRAALDGVLTIEVDSRVESLEEQEDARWHQLLNAHQENPDRGIGRRGKIRERMGCGDYLLQWIPYHYPNE